MEIKGMSRVPEFNDRPLTLRAIADEVRQVNIKLGWRAPDGGLCEGQTFGDYIALAHTELSEALEAYRDHRLADATGEFGPGQCSCAMSEASMNNCLMHGPEALPRPEGVGSEFADLLIRLVDMADVFGINLEVEYRRKIAYNRTRAYQHGGRTLAGAKQADPRLASGGGKTMRFNALRNAMPTDPRDWWVSDEVDEFLATWQQLDLPEAVMVDAEGARLTLWCVDMPAAAALVDMTDAVVGGQGFEIVNGAYSVGVVQAEEKKETKDA